ncbi:hypothetical protein N7504_004989 [Penicillium tannophilum]|nr:hypothetical protein N7504_004989 [Penicillium tannophilum]
MYVRTGLLSFIGAGLFFGALHLLGFVRLYTGQSYGDVTCALASSVMAILSIPYNGAENERLIPREMGLLGMYGGAVFASKVSVERVVRRIPTWKSLDPTPTGNVAEV